MAAFIGRDRKLLKQIQPSLDTSTLSESRCSNSPRRSPNQSVQLFGSHTRQPSAFFRNVDPQCHLGHIQHVLGKRIVAPGLQPISGPHLLGSSLGTEWFADIATALRAMPAKYTWVLRQRVSIFRYLWRRGIVVKGDDAGMRSSPKPSSQCVRPIPVSLDWGRFAPQREQALMEQITTPCF